MRSFNLIEKEEKQHKIIGKTIMTSRSVSALQKMATGSLNDFYIIYIQASIILGMAFVSSFLWYLIKSEYQIISDDVINIGVLEIVYLLIGLPFFLLSFTIFFRGILKIWFTIIISITFFLGISAFFYQDAFTFGLFLEHSNLTFSLFFCLILFLLAIFLWRGLFLVSFLGLGGIIVYFLIMLNNLTYPQILGSADIIKTQEPNNIVHILIDNHINLQYLSEIETKYPELKTKDFIVKFYQDNNFTLTPKAYATYINPVSEINNLLNFGNYNEANVIGKEYTTKINYDNGIDKYLTKNFYFDMVKKGNYSLNVYQNYDVDFCTFAGDKIAKCYSFFPANSLETKDDIINAYLSSFSQLPSFVKNNLTYANMPIANEQQEILDKVKDDIIKAKGKNLFFVHLSSLKAPYIYNNNCEVVKASGDKVADYIGQLGCFYKKLDNFFSDLKVAGVLDSNKIIIQGLSGASFLKDTIEDNKSYNQKDSLDLTKDAYFSIFAIKNQNQNLFEEDKIACDMKTLLLRSLGKRNAECNPIKIEDFSLDSYYEFMTFLQQWLDNFQLKN